MKTVSGRKVRQVVGEQQKTLAELTSDIQVAINNEFITRQRVDALEAFFRRPWWARWCWVVTGYCPMPEPVRTAPAADEAPQ